MVEYSCVGGVESSCDGGVELALIVMVEYNCVGGVDFESICDGRG